MVEAGLIDPDERIELIDALPRHDTGKLYKAELIERFAQPQNGK